MKLASEPLAPMTQHAAQIRSIKVLFVEDSAEDTILAVHELRSGGFDPEYEQVDSAGALRAALARQSWDVVISDHTLPGFSGLAAFDIVRSSGLDIPFVFVSGTIGRDVAVAALKAGAHDYFLKGNLTGLAPAIQRELEWAEKSRTGRWADAPVVRNGAAIHRLPDGAQEIGAPPDFEEPAQAMEKFRALASQLEKVREEERTRIAREIHDDLGQALTAIRFELTTLFRNLPEGQDFARSKAPSILGLIDSTIQRVRIIATDLRPGILDKVGLVAAIEWATGEFRDRTGIKCLTSLPEKEFALDREQSAAIFRIFQETLTNVARHSGATELQVRLFGRDGNVILEVQDNGRGIRPKLVTSSSSLGILGMQERARAFHGVVKIAGRPRKGTMVTVSFPDKPPIAQE